MTLWIKTLFDGQVRSDIRDQFYSVSFLLRNVSSNAPGSKKQYHYKNIKNLKEFVNKNTVLELNIDIYVFLV